MGDLRSTARTLEAELGIAFKDVRIEEHDGVAAELTDYYEMIDRVRPLAVKMEQSGNVLFVGLRNGDPAHRLFLMPVSSLDIVRLFRVGVHNQSDEAWTAVEKSLRKIHADVPFSVYFADAAGYKAAFADKVEKKDAKRFERIILDVDPEAMDIGDLPVWEMIHKGGIFQLWWD